jgi:hypothetical protein
MSYQSKWEWICEAAGDTVWPMTQLS